MEVGEQVAVDAPEPGGVLSLAEALHLHHVDELEPANPALTLAQPGARGVL